MSKAKRCPKCGEPPVVTKEEDFLDSSHETWGIFHVCKKGFNVDEGPCISQDDAIDAWNYHLEQAAV